MPKRFFKKAAASAAAGLILSLAAAACMHVSPPAAETEQTGENLPSSASGSLPERTDPASETGPAHTAAAGTTETGSTSSRPEEREETSESSPAAGTSSGTSINRTKNTTRPEKDPEISETTPAASDENDAVKAWWEYIGGKEHPGDPEKSFGSFADPVPVNETAVFDGFDTLFDPFRAEVSVQKIYRGPEALQMVKDASPLNPAPKDEQEYLIAQVLVKIISSKNSEVVDISPYFFSLAGEDSRIYGDVTLFRSVTPVLSPIGEGETSIGYICFQVDKTDEKPYIVFLSRAHGGLWFKTRDEEAEEETPAENTSEGRQSGRKSTREKPKDTR